jgi:hypothetical protein
MYSSAATTFTYAIGEEVVVRLDNVEVFDLDNMAVIPAAFLPGWTIGRIRSLVLVGERRRYLLRTELCERTCICIVDEGLIDGLA